MKLMESINAKIKEAMVNKDADTRDALRAVKSAANLTAKEKHSEEVTDEMLVNAVKKEIKLMNQTVASLAGKEDSDLYKSAVKKIKALETFLPEEMSEDELRTVIKNILSNVDPSANFGVKMQAVMKELKGKADGKVIQKIVKEL